MNIVLVLGRWRHSPERLLCRVLPDYFDYWYAVDANVLIFERIRENLTGQITFYAIELVIPDASRQCLTPMSLPCLFAFDSA